MRRVLLPKMKPIRRGSSPTLHFDIPYRPDLITGGYITFAQRGTVLFEKAFDDPSVELGDFFVEVDLTEKETLELTSYDTLKAQLRFIFKYGKTGGSDIFEYPVDDVL